jgi:protease-4
MLADGLLQQSAFNQKLIDRVGYDAEGETFLQFDFVDYLLPDMPMPAALDLSMGGNKIAVLYIEGVIIDGKGDDGFAGADTIIKHLRELREQSSVKALVIRVNSPGGSSSASSRIAQEIEMTREKLPVVISMGGVGASGGYMVAAVGDQVFVQPTTITGSIGVVSMLPNIEKMAEKLSINIEAVETHPFAGSFSLGRVKTDEEMRQLRALGAQIYDEFLEVVARNRDMTVDEVRRVAKGRVWSGKAAIENGLADAEGGLAMAIQRAADMAGIGNDYKVIDRPRILTLEEQIQEMFVDSKMDYFGESVGLESLITDVQWELKRLKAFNDPHGQYLILPYSLKVY